MADADTVASLGAKVTDVFVGAFGANANTSVVFLPFAIPVAADEIVQNGIVNPTQLAAALTANFDAPFAVAPSQFGVHGKDLSYGTASQIYALAVTSAQPTAPVGSDTWKRLVAEIAAAQALLTPAGVAPSMTCVPQDWLIPGNDSVWTSFDSTRTQAVAASAASVAAGAAAKPAVSPAVWAIKAPLAQPASIHGLTTTQGVPHLAFETSPAAGAMQPLAARVTIAIDRSELVGHQVGRVGSLGPVHPWPIFHPPNIPGPPPPPPPPPVPACSSSVAVHFDYLAAAIGFTATGNTIWDGVFLADAGWCIPGMARGALLPAPAASGEQGQPLVYGLPIAIIVVRNLVIAVKWSGQEQALLGDGGYLGPFSLAGATPAAAPDGAWTYSRPGPQVIALLCSQLPVLPPADAPDIAAALLPATA